MNLYELAPTLHWSQNTEAQAKATVKTANHTYDLEIKCQKYSADHVVGWLSKVIDREKDMDRGRYVELSCKENRASFDGVDATFDKVIDALSSYKKDNNLKYLLLFSTTQSRKEVFEKLAKKLGKKLDWDVYQDRNYILVHKKTLRIHQVD